jgi:hypothetical protein
MQLLDRSQVLMLSGNKIITLILKWMNRLNLLSKMKKILGKGPLTRKRIQDKPKNPPLMQNLTIHIPCHNNLSILKIKGKMWTPLRSLKRLNRLNLIKNFQIKNIKFLKVPLRKRCSLNHLSRILMFWSTTYLQTSCLPSQTSVHHLDRGSSIITSRKSLSTKSSQLPTKLGKTNKE